MDTNGNDVEVLVVGGGIGGLANALALTAVIGHRARLGACRARCAAGSRPARLLLHRLAVWTDGADPRARAADVHPDPRDVGFDAMRDR